VKVLFLCTGNSIRSQIAEAWARHLKPDEIDAYSAGIAPCGLNSYAVEVMEEVGIDISGQESKHVDSLRHIDFDYVVTLCSYAHDRCPNFPGKTKVIHVEFDDPMMLAEDDDTTEEILSHFRRVRDEIKTFVKDLPAALLELSGL
jgi:arsenate reductase